MSALIALAEAVAAPAPLFQWGVGDSRLRYADDDYDGGRFRLVWEHRGGRDDHHQPSTESGSDFDGG